MQEVNSARTFSNAKIGELRSSLASIVPDGELIVTCGSYARREASASSDIDFFYIGSTCDSNAMLPWMVSANAAIKKLVPKMPADGGAFATTVPRNEILQNFGGSDDSNATITRRMLYLLEGEWLTSEKVFHEIREHIIDTYIEETPADNQLAFYLLNDIIRYWRTITVDYSNKTSGISNPKPWAVRNVKLIFSRKLIYASGLFSVALTADRTKAEKKNILIQMFNLTPIDRIRYICGESASERLISIYDLFLTRLADASLRDRLDRLSREDKYDEPEYRELKNEGHYFSRELLGLFEKTFHKSHPIHSAVVF